MRVHLPGPNGKVIREKSGGRTAVALLGPDDEITVEQLSEDFLGQCQQVGLTTDETPTVETGASLLDEPTSLDRLEMLAIRKAVEECSGNISAAARRLGISRNTLYRKLQED